MSAVRANRRRLLWIIGVVTVAMALLLGAVDPSQEETEGPNIIAFELAASENRAAEILDEWGPEGRDAARLQIWLDFAYLALYGAFLALAVQATRDTAIRRGWRRLARPGAWIAAVPLAAAAADALEDVNMLITISGDGGAVTPALAAGFAVVKFPLTAVSIAYVLAGLIVRLLDRRATP